MKRLNGLESLPVPVTLQERLYRCEPLQPFQCNGAQRYKVPLDGANSRLFLNWLQMKDLMTLREAAEVVGTSKTRLWRSIKDELLEAQEVRRGKQKVYKVSKTSLMAWANKQDDLEIVHETVQRSETARNVTGDRSETMRNDTNRYTETPVTIRNVTESMVPLSAFETAQATLKQALQDALEVAREQREDRLEAERRAGEAEENAFRMARQVQDLMYNLDKQNHLLSENAESLLEDRAKSLQVESQLKEFQASKKLEEAQIEELYRHKAEEKAQLEREKEEMADKLRQSERATEKALAEAREQTEHLKEARTQLQSWEEQRKTPFWKRWFKTG